jgi:glutathione reductase (NADPH)
VPKKLFVYGSHFHEDFADSSAYGWSVDTNGFDWPTLRDNKTREIERLNGVYRNLLSGAGVELHEGRAKFVDPHTIDVDGRRYSARHVLIATGGWPVVPDVSGREHVITSNEAFYLPEFPRRVAVVGGGYIAVEFAGIFAGLGVDTTLIYRGPLFMRGFDDSVRKFVKEEIEKKGVKLLFDTNVESIELDQGVRRLRLSTGDELQAETVLYATGRAPNTRDLDLPAAGVTCGSNGAVVVDHD